MEKNENISVLDYLRQKLSKYIEKFDVILFFAVFAAAILVHLYMFTHKFINHDDIDGLYSNCSFGLTSGRWLLQFMTGLTGNFSSSWLNGLAGSFYLALSGVFLSHLFRIRRYLPAMLMSLCVVAFPVIASTYSYMFCAPQYLFSLLFAVVGVYLIRQEKWKWMLLGSVAIALSMGCYQAYFSLAAVLLVTLVGLDLVEDRFGKDLKKTVLTAVKYVLFLAGGMVLYFIILKICLWVNDAELVSYQGIGEMGKLTFSVLVDRVVAAYKFCKHFYTNAYGIFHKIFPYIVGVSFVLQAIAVITTVVRRKLYRRPWTMVLLIAVLAVLPLGCGLVFVMADPSTVHTVMMFAVLIPLLYPAIILDRIRISPAEQKSLSRGKVVMAVLLILVLSVQAYEFVLITNRAYFSMDMTYENAYSYYVKLTGKIEMQEGYTEDSFVAMIGSKTMDNFVPPTNLTGIPTGDEALNIYSYARYLSYFHGSNYRFASQQVKDEIMATEEFKAMPVYPAEGSIKTINGVITVKLS